jgi:uncharacterized coiled-coil protein SlyX
MTSKAILAMIGGALLGFCALAASPVVAQSANPSTSTLNDVVGRHHQMQQMMMQDMTQQMTRMTEQMSRGQPTPKESKAMAGQMSRMSRMMHFMSGLEARPAHTDAEMRKQMDQMQAQMKNMTNSMGSAAPK